MHCHVARCMRAPRVTAYPFPDALQRRRRESQLWLSEEGSAGSWSPLPHVMTSCVEAVASELDATPAQIALAWLLAQGDDIAPIPGTKQVSRVEENTAADGIELRAEQIARLNQLTPATGERHDEANMSTIDR